MASTSERAPLLLEQPCPRNQDREKEVEEEVKRSCQNIQWTRGPLPKNIDHWFYDLRAAGTVPRASLVAASRAMVLKWKDTLGGDYFPYRHSAGGSVMSLEHAHRTFKALTRDLPNSGWVSRACAKHQFELMLWRAWDCLLFVFCPACISFLHEGPKNVALESLGLSSFCFLPGISFLHEGLKYIALESLRLFSLCFLPGISFLHEDPKNSNEWAWNPPLLVFELCTSRVEEEDLSGRGGPSEPSEEEDLQWRRRIDLQYA
jgi:hypothetical protein